MRCAFGHGFQILPHRLELHIQTLTYHASEELSNINHIQHVLFFNHQVYYLDC